MSSPQDKSKFTPELRILAASLLSMAVILLWAKYFGPKPPVNAPQANRAAQTAPATAGATPSAASPEPAVSPTPDVQVNKNAPALPTTVKTIRETAERTIVIENDLYRVEFSNRGAVVKSWKLKKYKDDSKPQQILDVAHPEASQATGSWPFAIALDDPQLQTTANSGIYQVTSTGDSSAGAPVDTDFSWSDGHLEITKHFHFEHSYVVRVETSAKLDGKLLTTGLTWQGSFGDLTVSNPSPIETVSIFSSEGGKVTNVVAKKLDDLSKVGTGTWFGGKDFTGIEDRYFTAAFLPASGAAPGTLQTRYWKVDRPVKLNNQDATEPTPAIATSSGAGQATALRVYVGPKDYDDLKRMNPPLNGLVNFGWMEFIADPLFHGLKLIYKYVPNWGWAIVILTLVINTLLFPLRISSYKTTLKMQRVGPEIKAIQDKYKKYTMRDPRKADMNKEVMAVYSREGINPVGGCFQMFLQMPVWFGLNTALRYAIEMRHARWFGWITDLSSRDPYYVLPVAMGLSMYLVSKMTPMTSTDPQQQMMMKIMPITMAGIFIISPISSGLAVYILTSSLVGIMQQWYLNRTHPAPPPAKLTKSKK